MSKPDSASKNSDTITERVRKSVSSIEKNSAIISQALPATESFVNDFNALAKITEQLSALASQLNPIGFGVMVASVVISAGNMAMESWRKGEKARFEEWAGVFALSAAKQEAILGGYTEDMKAVLEDAKTKFVEILKLDESSNTDAYAVKMEMMKLIMEKGVVDSEQIAAMYESANVQLQVEMDGLEMEFLESKALANLNYDGADRTAKIEELSKEYNDRKGELERYNTEFYSFMIQNYEDAVLKAMTGSDSTYLNEIFQYINDSTMNAAQMDLEHVKKGLLENDASVLEGLVRYAYSRISGDGKTDEEIRNGLEANPDVRQSVENFMTGYMADILTISSDNQGPLLEVYRNTIEPKLFENQKRIEEDKAASRETDAALLSQTALLERVGESLLAVLSGGHTSLSADAVSLFLDSTSSPRNQFQKTTYLPGERGAGGGAGTSIAAPTVAEGTGIGGLGQLPEQIAEIGPQVQAAGEAAAPLIEAGMQVMFEPMISGLAAVNQECGVMLQSTLALFTAFSMGLSNAFAENADAISIGLNFSRGIADGIESGTGLGWIRAAARKAAAAAKEAAMQALQEHSPSRVGKGIGANFSIGIAKGIEGAQRDVSGASAGLARMARDGLRFRAPGVLDRIGVREEAGRSAVVIDYGRLADAMAQRPAVFRVGDREIAQATVGANADALARRSRAIVNGFGG